MELGWRDKECLDDAKKLAESIIVDLYEAHIIDDEQYKSALEIANTKIADRIDEHDKDIRNACREIISTAVSEAVKRAVI